MKYDRRSDFQAAMQAACIYADGELFTLASGKKSDFYFEGRHITLSPGPLYEASMELFGLCEKWSIHAIAGVPLGACPLVAGIGMMSVFHGYDMRLFYVRKEAKGHGLGKRIEGPGTVAGLEIALIEDTITTGGTLIEAACELRAAGARVTRAFCLLDREEGGRGNLSALGIELESLYTKSQVISARGGLTKA